MNDIVERLLASVTQCRAVDRSDLLAEAAAEIERLRLAGGDAEIARLRLEAAHAEIARLRLTDSEKKAVNSALGWCDDRDTETIATLCGLLERMR